MKTKSILTVAIAAAAIAIGSLGGASEASAKKGFHGGKHGHSHGHKGHGHRWHGHRWHGHRWRGRFFYAPAFYGGYEDPCYLARKRGRLLKICPVY